MYRNSEGYASPTEGEALAHIIHEERVKARAERCKQMRYDYVWHNRRPYTEQKHRRRGGKKHG